MRSIPTLTLIALMALSVSTLRTFADDEPIKGDLAKLQGSWSFMGGPNKDVLTTLVIKGRTIEYTIARPNSELHKGKGEIIKLDENANPKTMDLKFTGQDGRDSPARQVIYKLDGDTWVECRWGPGGERPAKFEVGEGGPPFITTFTRVKEIADDKPIKTDLDKLQGNWTAKVGPDKDIPITLTIKANTAEVTGSRDGEGFKLKGELKIDEKASPKALDWVNFTGPDGQAMPDNLSIYKLDGDSLTICSGGGGNGRPTKFEAGEGGPPMLTTFARVKEKADDNPIKGDLAKFQGTWTAAAGDNDEVMITMTVKVNAYTAKWDTGDGTNIELKGELRLSDQAKPNKTIDFFNTKRNDGEETKDSLGIYEIDGDKIKLCVGDGGEERPTEFKRGDGGTPHLLTFTRKKD